MPKPYTLTSQQRETYSIMALLDYLENQSTIPVLLEGDDALLESLLGVAFKKGLVSVPGNAYHISPLGRETLRKFMKRFSDFLARLDVFHSVDLTKGEFALAKCWDLEPDAYITYLKDDRWEDLRVAVAEYLKLDPLEIIFMSFLNEGRIDTTAPGWQFELALGSMWDEIVKIASSNLQAQDLGYADISWEVVIKDVIQQGNVVMKSLLLQEQELRAQGALDPVEEPEDDVIVVTTVTSVTYYDDPWFYDPYWYDPYW